MTPTTTISAPPAPPFSPVPAYPKLLSNPATSKVADAKFIVLQPSGLYTRPDMLINTAAEEAAARADGFTVEEAAARADGFTVEVPGPGATTGMKCPRCAFDAEGVPLAKQHKFPDMIRNHRESDGKLYRRCNGCGFLVEEEQQDPPTPEALKKKIAELEAEKAAHLKQLSAKDEKIAQLAAALP